MRTGARYCDAQRKGRPTPGGGGGLSEPCGSGPIHGGGRGERLLAAMSRVARAEENDADPVASGSAAEVTGAADRSDVGADERARHGPTFAETVRSRGMGGGRRSMACADPRPRAMHRYLDASVSGCIGIWSGPSCSVSGRNPRQGGSRADRGQEGTITWTSSTTSTPERPREAGIASSRRPPPRWSASPSRSCPPLPAVPAKRRVLTAPPRCPRTGPARLRSSWPCDGDRAGSVRMPARSGREAPLRGGTGRRPCRTRRSGSAGRAMSSAPRGPRGR